MHGDVPISFTTQPQPTTRTHGTRPNTQHDNPDNTQKRKSKNHDTITVTMVQKKTRSLISDDRIQELIQELDELKDSHWDFVTINETWREQELWIRPPSEQQETAKQDTEQQSSSTRDGPNRLKKCDTLCQDSRESQSRQKFRLQVIYSLHTGDGDEQVQQVFSEHQNHTDRCRETITRTHADWTRLQCASGSKRGTRRNRLQMRRRAPKWHAKQQRSGPYNSNSLCGWAPQMSQGTESRSEAV